MPNVVPHHSPHVVGNSVTSFLEVKKQVGTKSHHIPKEHCAKNFENEFASEGGLNRFFLKR